MDELLELLVPVVIGRTRPSWHAKAACIGSDVDFFSARSADVDAARQVCRGCPG